jgi:hypothetical protein
MKLAPRQTQAQYNFRAQLGREFVAHYQIVLATAPEAFARYCETFRSKWLAGA